MANQYLSEDLGEVAVGAVAVVAGAEARHAVTVSRLAVGETVRVGNGVGTIATGTVTSVESSEFRFEVAAVQKVEHPTPEIWLVQALAKGDRDELAIQAATELGVDRIIPWAASRSIARWEGDRATKGRQRWMSVVREATKQSAHAWTPEVDPVATTKELGALAIARPGDALMVVLDPTAEHSLVELSVTFADLILVVGPEGGIAPAELESLLDSAAVNARLGDGILRTSTAGPAAIAVLSAKLGRW